MKITKETFKNPSREFCSKTFWSWNGKLEDDELKEQIRFFHKMGLQGFYMHPREGFDTEYLSEEFFDAVRVCIDTAKDLNMKAELYDEDGYPSGFAGGFATQEDWAKLKHILFTKNEQPENEKCRLIAMYDISLNEKGELKSYSIVSDKAKAKGKIHYVYLRIAPLSGWHNMGAANDVLNPKATELFIKLTHDEYKKRFADEFGKIMTASFSDEPHYAKNVPLNTPYDDADLRFAWTTDFDDTFADMYGYSLLAHIPKLVWESEDGSHTYVRYCYNNHVSYRFAKGFFEPYAKWCKENGLDFVAHTLSEQYLFEQTREAGEAMRMYSYMDITGIDVLRNQLELSTAKQCQSVMHQYGKKGMMSEMYGVTNWDFDMREEKYGGDWQAALGVTERVLHLSWYTMKHRAKFDCPASLNYQLPWCYEYKILEDHYSRLNSILTQGKPVVKVGVIHPIETMWLYTGSNQTNGEQRKQTEQNFNNIIEWLLESSIDFDFIAESLIPEQDIKTENSRLTVGCMTYDAIVVPQLQTIRSTTLNVLTDFVKNGGKVIFIGECPDYCNGQPCDRARDLYERSIKLEATKYAISNALENERTVRIQNADYTTTEDMIYTLRENDADRWLFVAHAKRPSTYEAASVRKLIITTEGEYNAELYDTVTGDVKPLKTTVYGGKTNIEASVYPTDSLLIRLTKEAVDETCEIAVQSEQIDIPYTLDYTLEEDNVLILDNAEYSLDGTEFNSNEDILKISDICREHFGYYTEEYIREEQVFTDPWLSKKGGVKEHIITLRFTVDSEINTDTLYFACEEIKSLDVNGEEVPLNDAGYFTDKAIRKYSIPPLKKGTNIITIKMPYSIVYGLEYCYLLGKFGVELAGRQKTIVNLPERLGFSTLTMQKLPFYGANVKLNTKISLDKDSNIKIKIPSYKCGGVKLYIDGNPIGVVAFAPYICDAGKFAKGEHEITFEILGNRYNTFGALHNFTESDLCYGIGYWKTKGDGWGYEYRLRDFGILSSPVIIKEELK